MKDSTSSPRSVGARTAGWTLPLTETPVMEAWAPTIIDAPTTARVRTVFIDSAQVNLPGIQEWKWKPHNPSREIGQGISGSVSGSLTTSDRPGPSHCHRGALPSFHSEMLLLCFGSQGTRLHEGDGAAGFSMQRVRPPMTRSALQRWQTRREQRASAGRPLGGESAVEGVPRHMQWTCRTADQSHPELQPLPSGRLAAHQSNWRTARVGQGRPPVPMEGPSRDPFCLAVGFGRRRAVAGQP